MPDMLLSLKNADDPRLLCPMMTGWDVRSVRELLQLAGINIAALLERHEVMTACQHQLDRMPKPVGLALLRPFTCTPTGMQ